MRSRRHYTDTEKVEAVGMALTLGAEEASRRLGIPRRSISLWRAHPRYGEVIAREQQALGPRLRAAVEEALTSVLDGLRSPKSNLGHRARALEVLHNSLQLVEGGPTERVESASVNFNASWQPPAGAEPILTGAELKLLDRYLAALDKGQAPVIDVPPRLLTEAVTMPEPEPDTAPDPSAAPGPSTGLWDAIEDSERG